MMALEKDPRLDATRRPTPLATDVRGLHLDEQAREGRSSVDVVPVRQVRQEEPTGKVSIAGAAATVAVTGVVGLAVSRGDGRRGRCCRRSRARKTSGVEGYFQRITVAHRELSIDGRPGVALRGDSRAVR